ncbi:MAG: carbohydrate-binding protein [Paludibacteraceae bacterium]|nr:carbohydrate-binding protein [Paludibacteraceae bacterium]
MKKSLVLFIFAFFFGFSGWAGNNYGYTTAIRDNMIGSWLNAYYTPTEYGHKISGGFWSEAENMEILLDAYEATGDLSYKTRFDEVYKHFYATQWQWNYQAGNWMPNDFNDDIMWISIACLRAYMLFGTQAYFDIGKRHFDQTYERAITDQGLMVWRQWYNGITQTTSGSNSCICGPTEVAACYLGLITGDESYFTKARNMYAAQREYLYNPESGAVYDSFSRDQNDLNNRAKFNYNYWSSTYNQGTYLGAACMLYMHYGDEQYYNDATKIMDYCVNHLSNAEGYVNVCGTNDRDLDGFKGILMRYARRFIIDLRHPEYLWWMQKNCMGAYGHRRASDGLIWTAWWQQTEDNTSYTAFGCGTAASLAVNTYIDDNRIIKAGFAKIEAENFDYIKGVMVNNPGTGSANLGGVQNGHYTGYNNINFGNNKATKVIFRYAAIDNAGSIEVRQGSPTGTLLGTATLTSTGDWDTFTEVTCDITPISGMQNIYLVYKTTNSYVCNLDYLVFWTDNFLYNDITDNGGTVSCSSFIPWQTEGTAQLVDNSLDTKMYAYCGDNPSELWVKYESPRNARVYGYAICSANDSQNRDPKSWVFEASADNAGWVTLDTQSGVVFGARKEKKSYTVDNAQYFKFFRIRVTERYGDDTGFQLSDWQIYGLEDFQDNILTDGGTLTYQYAGNGNNEGIAKLTDKKLDKYLIFNAKSGWVEYTATKAYHPICYTLTSANDALERDPLSWALYGANDNENWVELDRQTGALFYGRNTTQCYPITCDDSYKRYRFEVLDNNGAAMIQLAELQIFGTRGRFPTDLTDNGGTLTASNFGGGNEGTAKIIDNLSNTKNYIYIGATFNQVWYRYESAVPAVLNWYTITSANDTQARDPKSWKLQGSNDGNNWTDLDTQNNVTFTARFQTKRFDISGNSTAYKYFRLYITERYANTDNGFQMAEWQLYGVEQIPANEQATAVEEVIQTPGCTLYPNPASHYVYVGGLTEPASYTVYGLNGRVLLSGSVQVGDTIDIQGLAPGLYLIRINQQSIRFVKR